MRPLLLIALLLLSAPARAQDIAAAMRANHWDEAAALAAVYPDPLAAKLVAFYRLLSPYAGTAREIDEFVTANPGWPLQDQLARRRDEALAREPDDAQAAASCAHLPPVTAPAWLRCATAASQLGQPTQAAEAARRAWITGLASPAAELAFLQRWSAVLRPADQEARFDTLAWTDTVSAGRQLPRLDGADKPAAEARLALRRDEATAVSLLATLPAAQRSEPALFLEQARYLRRAGREVEALALWVEHGAQAERDAPAARVAAFWAERNLLARRRLREGDAAGAYALVTDHAQRVAEPVADAEFLAGFIALRFLHDPDAAGGHFRTLQAASKAAITQARAHYWLGRVADARGDRAAQHSEFTEAAAWPTTYYGQLATLADGQDLAQLHARIAQLHDPAWTPAQAVNFAGREFARAATLLVAWGERGRAHSFLLRLADVATDTPTDLAADRALAGRLASAFAMPDVAVMIARRAGRDGVMLPETGWPVPLRVADGVVPAATVLGIIRQESSFDPSVVSPVGARGLMQLMPATALSVGKKLGQTPTVPSLTADPALNVSLGTSYLRSLLDQFGGQIQLAAAAYNAGPARVGEWLTTNGDPRAGVDLTDWIELIPFDETRNYVQRVSENIVIYNSRHAASTPLVVADGDHP